MKITKAKKPHGYRKTKLFFHSKEQAKDYVNFLKNQFLLNKAKKLEHPDLSKRRRTQLRNKRPKEYLLTKEGNKYCLWEEMK